MKKIGAFWGKMCIMLTVVVKSICTTLFKQKFFLFLLEKVEGYPLSKVNSILGLRENLSEI